MYSTLPNANLNANHEEVKDSFFWWVEHWNTTKFVGSKIPLK